MLLLLAAVLLFWVSCATFMSNCVFAVWAYPSPYSPPPGYASSAVGVGGRAGGHQAAQHGAGKPLPAAGDAAAPVQAICPGELRRAGACGDAGPAAPEGATTLSTVYRPPPIGYLRHPLSVCLMSLCYCCVHHACVSLLVVSKRVL